MRIGPAILLLVAGGAGAFLVFQLWDAYTAEEPQLSAQGRAFVQEADNILNRQIEADELAATRAHFPSVREFARSAYTEHQQIRTNVKELMSHNGVDFSSRNLTSQPSLRGLYGVAFDREYLQNFITNHDAAESAIQQLPKSGEPESLQRFVALWAGMVNRHKDSARDVLGNLPDTASNVELLLLVGIAALAASGAITLRQRVRAT